jgi:hypothetical protein
MSHSVTNLECNKCNEKYSGILHGIFRPEKQYFSECPKCTKHTFFYGVTDIVDSEIPGNAVEIKFVAKL